MDNHLNSMKLFFPSFVVMCKDDDSSEKTKQLLRKINEKMELLNKIFSSNQNSRKWTKTETQDIGNYFIIYLF